MLLNLQQLIFIDNGFDIFKLIISDSDVLHFTFYSGSVMVLFSKQTYQYEVLIEGDKSAYIGLYFGSRAVFLAPGSIALFSLEYHNLKTVGVRSV